MTFLEKYSNVKVDALHLINQVNHMIQKYEFSLNTPETHQKIHNDLYLLFSNCCDRLHFNVSMGSNYWDVTIHPLDEFSLDFFKAFFNTDSIIKVDCIIENND